MMPAVIDLAFDPLVRIGGSTYRLETIALAAILLVALLVMVRIGWVTPSVGPYVPAPPLRADELLYLVLGIVPGAVIGGRIEYVLLHFDYYSVHTSAIVDPAQGSLALALGIVGGIVGGAVIARLIGAPIDRWMHAATLPLLFVLATGKLVGVLGGTGQGAPSSVAWATAYHGAGPWGSLAANLPSQPSQVYEAIATVLVILVVGILLRLGVFARRDGAAMLVALALWAIGRFVVVYTWRDAPVAGSLRAEQLILAALIVGSLALVVAIRWLADRRERAGAAASR